LFSIRYCEESRRFYDRKLAEASVTLKPSSPSPAAVSTSSGLSCAMDGATNTLPPSP